jgi:hypothetical protein
MDDVSSVGEDAELPDDRFKALLGRALRPEDRERLLGVRKALGIRPNDAVWDVMIALDYHLQLYSAVPRELEAQGKRLVADLGSLLVDARKEKPAGAPRPVPTGNRAAPPRDWSAPALTFAAAAVGFGALCIAAGYAMAARGIQAWGVPGPLGAVLGAPAGWLMFVLLLPVASRWAKMGWVATRAAENWKLRALGWMVLLGSIGFVVGGLWVLALALRQ